MYNPPTSVPSTGLADAEESLLYVLEEYSAGLFRLKVGGTLTTTETPPAVITDGSNVLSTAGEKLVAASTPCIGVLLYNSSSTITMFLGSATGQTFPLLPLERMFYPIADASTLYAKSASGTPTLNYNILSAAA